MYYHMWITYNAVWLGQSLDYFFSGHFTDEQDNHCTEEVKRLEAVANVNYCRWI